MKSIDINTKIYGIVGYPLSHSFSPVMYNTAFNYLGINSIYVPFPVKNLTGLKMSINKIGIRGISVTIPHKVKIRRILDKIDPLALRIGSVNTIKKNSENLLEGYNTDGLGAVQAIKESNFKLYNKKILIIGSGGSAKAIAYSLLNEDVSKIGILSRNRYSMAQITRGLLTERRKIMVEKIFMEYTRNTSSVFSSVQSKTSLIPSLVSPSQIEEYDLVINTTPIGMKNFDCDVQSPLPADFLFNHQVVFDIVYNPQHTLFTQYADEKGCSVIYGYKMLLYQGVSQFSILTDMEAPIDIMESALLKQL